MHPVIITNYNYIYIMSVLIKESQCTQAAAAWESEEKVRGSSSSLGLDFFTHKQRNKLIGIMLFHPQTNKQTNQHSNNTNKRTNKATTDTNNMGVRGEGKVRGSSSPN